MFDYSPAVSRTTVLSGNSQQTLSDLPGSSQLRKSPLYYNQAPPTLPSVPAPARIPKCPCVRSNSQNAKSCLPALEFPNCFSCQRLPEFPNPTFSSVTQRSQIPKMKLYGSVRLVETISPFSGAITLPNSRSSLYESPVALFCERLLCFGRWGSKAFPALPPFQFTKVFNLCQ